MLETKLVRTSVDGDDHTLVLRRAASDAEALDPVFDLLPDGRPTNLLAVTHEQSQQFLDGWRDRFDRRLRNVGVVSVGEQMRSAACASVPRRANRPVLRGVPDETDVEAVCETVREFLDAWDGDATVAYVDAPASSVERLGPEETLALLDAFRWTLDARGATGYFCLTPADHDRAVVREVSSRFDTVVECVDDDSFDGAPSVGDCFDAMANARRRYVLAELGHGEAVPADELARLVADRTDATAEQIRASLRNVHLPRLADLGLVATSRGGDRVVAGPHFERAVPYLRTAADCEGFDSLANGE